MTEMDAEDTALSTARDFTLAQIKAWQADGSLDSEQTAEDTLRWFCACMQASQLLEMNTLKDWAGILIDGYKPMGLQAELESFNDYFDGDELIDEWQEELLKTLKQHFGIES